MVVQANAHVYAWLSVFRFLHLSAESLLSLQAYAYLQFKYMYRAPGVGLQLSTARIQRKYSIVSTVFKRVKQGNSDTSRLY